MLTPALHGYRSPMGYSRPCLQVLLAMDVRFVAKAT
jgi:hypothetical protein